MNLSIRRKNYNLRFQFVIIKQFQPTFTTKITLIA